jgi:hypothetical protein
VANTFVKIQTVTVGSGGQAAIEFTSIPQSYTDIKVLMSGIYSSNAGIYISLNGSTSGFTGRYLEGGSAASSGVLARYLGFGFAGEVSSIEVYLPNYTSANNKSFSSDSVGERNASPVYNDLTAGLWSNTAAITSITLTPDTGSLSQYSRATLYGIKSS